MIATSARKSSPSAQTPGKSRLRASRQRASLAACFPSLDNAMLQRQLQYASGRLSGPVLLLVLALFCPALLAADISPVVGTWTLTLETPRGTQHPTLVIEAGDDGYHGTYTGRMGPMQVPAIEVDGNHFTFHLTVSMPIGDMRMQYVGDVTGDAMAGEVQNARGSVPFTGERQAR